MSSKCPKSSEESLIGLIVSLLGSNGLYGTQPSGPDKDVGLPVSAAAPQPQSLRMAARAAAELHFGNMGGCQNCGPFLGP